MCTLTYIPLDHNQFILTSNRDERSERPTVPPLKVQIGGMAVFFPKDEEAGGTWIAAAENGTVCCLLNGAFEPHERKESYRQSRGKVLLELFECADVVDFFKKKNLEEIEPFTLIVVEKHQNFLLHELRWDGDIKHYKELDSKQAHIWSSAALYSKATRLLRKEWFENWLSKGALSDATGIMKFHASKHGDDTENDLLMERWGILKTVSITQIIAETDSFSMDYHDLLKKIKSNVTAAINPL